MTQRRASPVWGLPAVLEASDPLLDGLLAPLAAFYAPARDAGGEDGGAGPGGDCPAGRG